LVSPGSGDDDLTRNRSVSSTSRGLKGRGALPVEGEVAAAQIAHPGRIYPDAPILALAYSTRLTRMPIRGHPDPNQRGIWQRDF